MKIKERGKINNRNISQAYLMRFYYTYFHFKMETPHGIMLQAEAHGRIFNNDRNVSTTF